MYLTKILININNSCAREVLGDKERIRNVETKNQYWTWGPGWEIATCKESIREEGIQDILIIIIMIILYLM